MQDITQRVNAVLGKYGEQLADNGIKVTVSKRYFEASVRERTGAVGNGAIFNELDRAFDRKKEKSYHHVRNRYHLIVLSVRPVEKAILRREDCREYAFCVHKTERAHIGMEPRKYTCEEGKIQAKIEKRVRKVLRKAQKNPPEKVCKDRLWDALRYTATKYGYKRRFLNKERADWEMIFLFSFGLLAFAVALAIWRIGAFV